MKLLCVVLLSVLSYHCCTGYPVVEDEIFTENGTSTEFWFNASNETASIDSSPQDMHGFFKKVKDKMKDSFNKVKDKIKDCKDILTFLTFSVAVEVSEDILTENGTSIEFWYNVSNGTAFNDSLPLEMNGFFKKVVDKVKEKVKDFNKVKSKIKDCKDILKFLTFSVARESSEDTLIENGTYVGDWYNVSNETAINDSSPLDMHGFFKKVLDKVKDKMKDSFNEIKDKIKNCKDILKFLTFSVAGDVSEAILTENGTSIEYWFNASYGIAFNDSLPLGMNGFFKKVVDKVKEKVKDFNKVKSKIKDCKDIPKFLTFSVAREISEDTQTENGTSVEDWYNVSNETAIDDSLPLDMNGFGKKVVNKVKEGIKTVKDKVKDGYNKIKDKVKDGYNKVKDKINNFKDKIGSKGGSGGGSGGGYYRDKYDRDYDRDYYRKNSRSSGGSGVSDPTVVWILIGFGILILVTLVISIVYDKMKN